jgi:hypothetical protein
MGNTTSDVNITNTNNQLFTNKNYVNTVSENLNTQISNNIINDAKLCSAAINNNQEITINGFSTAGNFNFSADQNQTAALTFSCIQSTTVRNNTGSEIIAQMTNALQNNVNNEALAQLDTNAKNSATSDFGAIGNTQAKTNVNTINNYNSVTENHKDIENVVKNVVENNFSSETIQNCTNQANNNQNINLQNITVGGNTAIAINQTQAASVIAECIQKSEVGNSIVNNAATQLGVKVEDTTLASSSQSSKSVSDTSSTAKGLSDLFSSPGVIIGIVLACICSFCIVAIVVKMRSGGKTVSGSSGSSSGNKDAFITAFNTLGAMRRNR